MSDEAASVVGGMVDLVALDGTRDRLERALVLLDTIAHAHAELEALVGPGAPAPDDVRRMGGRVDVGGIHFGGKTIEPPPAAAPADTVDAPPAEPPQVSPEPADPPDAVQADPPAAPPQPSPEPADDPPYDDVEHPWDEDGISTKERGARKLAAVLAAFRARPRDWLAPRHVAEATGIPTAALKRPMGKLLRDGNLEHNGKVTDSARYRLKLWSDTVANGDLPAEPEPEPVIVKQRDRPPGLAPDCGQAPAALLGDLPDDLDPDDDEPPAPPAPRPTAADRARASALTGGPRDGSVAGRVLVSLSGEAGTTTDLARRLDVPRRDVAAAIRVLEDDGELLHAGTGAGAETVYAAANPVSV